MAGTSSSGIDVEMTFARIDKLLERNGILKLRSTVDVCHLWKPFERWTDEVNKDEKGLWNL